MPNFISEDQIEQALLRRLKDAHGYELLNCNTTDSDDINDGSKRRDKREVVFKDRLKDAGIRLNKNIPIDSLRGYKPPSSASFAHSAFLFKGSGTNLARPSQIPVPSEAKQKLNRPNLLR